MARATTYTVVTDWLAVHRASFPFNFSGGNTTVAKAATRTYK